jgi:hypothetical protein
MKQINSCMTLTIILSVIIAFSIPGCMRYLTQDRSKVLLNDVDVDQTLQIADLYLKEKKGGWGSALSVWVIRDQRITPQQAAHISRLYFHYVDGLKHSFDVWHFTWSIADIYRLGDEQVKNTLLDAYTDAAHRAKPLGGLVNKMVNGKKLYMGDAHAGGRAFARKHVVIPGNTKYVQSYSEYVRQKTAMK